MLGSSAFTFHFSISMPPQAIYELDHYFRLEGTSATSRGTKAVCTIRYCKKPTKRFSYLGQNTSSMISHLKSCHTFEFQLVCPVILASLLSTLTLLGGEQEGSENPRNWSSANRPQTLRKRVWTGRGRAAGAADCTAVLTAVVTKGNST